MANKLHGLAMAAAAQVSLHSPLGQFILAVGQALGGGGAVSDGGCCMNGLVLGNAGEEFTVVPLACPQPDTNYIVTGVLAGGDLSGGVDWAITAKTPTTFTIFVSGGIPVGGLLFDFLITRC